MPKIVAAGVLAATLLLPSAASAAPSTATDSPIGATLDVVTANGSGCPAGTTSVRLSEDASRVEIRYSSYYAQVGVGATSTDFRKNCQIALDVRGPGGYTYALTRADHYGQANLVSGARATQKTNYYFQGTSSNATAEHDFAGPLTGGWHTTDAPIMNSSSYAPCGEVRYLNINTELRVDAGTSNTNKTTSVIRMDASTISSYFLAWKKC